MFKIIFSALILLSVTTLPALAEDSYTLSYQKNNHWVATEDATGLRTMLKAARKEKVKHFMVQLPSTARETTIERLIVLRDILEKQLKYAVTIEEIDKNTEANKVIVTFKK